MEAIERYISDRRLQPGDSLPTESSLCTYLGVSRSSVREALRQLQALEIVSVQQGRGAFVGDMSLRPLVKSLLLRNSISPDSVEALRQVVAVRRILDLGIGTELVSLLAGTHHATLHELVDRMEAKAAQKEWFTEEDVAFHTTLLGLTDNVLAEQLSEAMWLLHMRAVNSVTRSVEGLLSTAQAHRKMLVAAENGDINAYASAVVEHYEPIEQVLTSAQN
ncbi:MAG: GntR family transcriptional regulator [Actinobacteria bacterium]|nr:MAG: GntR family transcriptional regulator [Actinomycetota bacterium]